MKYRVAVYTNDTRFYFKFLNGIRGTRVKATFFTLDHPPPEKNFDLVVSTENLSSLAIDIPIMHVKREEINEDLIPKIISLAARKNTPKFTRMIIGIDPGTEIGLAVICDGMLLIAETSELNGLNKKLERYLLTFPSSEIRFRIGDQPTSVSELIFNKVFRYFKDDERVSFELVPEAFSNVSGGFISKSLSSDELAAYKIGQRTGKELNHPIPTNISLGRLKEIQKWSRELSNNQITLDTKLAASVALGELSIQEAIRIKERSIEDKQNASN